MQVDAQVEVEVVLLTARTRLGYRVRRDRLRGSEAPDAAARRLARDATAPHGPEVLHSTSWRYEAGRVVLTYAALPAAAGDDTLPLEDPAVLSSGDPTAPAPPALHLHHVVAHAVRHLAQLAAHDPAVSRAAGDSRVPDLWQAIHEAARDMPTGTHAETHRAAARRRHAGTRAGMTSPVTG